MILRERIEAILQRTISEWSVSGDVQLDTSGWLQDYGLDSLDFVELVIELEDTFRIELDDDKLATVKSFDDLIALVQAAS